MDDTTKEIRRDKKRRSSELTLLEAKDSTHLSHVALQPPVGEGRARTARKTVDIFGAQRGAPWQDVRVLRRQTSGSIKLARGRLAATGRGSDDSGVAEGPNTIDRWNQQRAVMEAQIRSKDALIERQAAYIEELKQVRRDLERQLAAANERMARSTRRSRRVRT
jgi:hypothetical protein